MLSLDHSIVAVSDDYLKATMTDRAAIIGRNLFELFPDNPNDPDASGAANLRASINRVKFNAAPDTMAIQRHDIRGPDGVFKEHYWSPVNSPVFDADHHIKYIVHRVEDVTEYARQKSQPPLNPTATHVKMEQMESEIFNSSQKIQDANQQLEAGNKELEAFSYSVSHDLREPLRAMDGFSRALLEDYGFQLPEEGQDFLREIRRGAQRMGNLIDDLLTFSRLSRAPMKKDDVDMERLLRGVIEDMHAQRKGREINIQINDLPNCVGDPALLKQVWVNILSNAFKYTLKRAVANVEIGCMRVKSEHVYFVRDNGNGFDMRYAEKLFGVFQRLHRAEEYDGTGVGLAIVHRIVTRHGGRVWAEAAVDQGATFYFAL